MSTSGSKVRLKVSALVVATALGLIALDRSIAFVLDRLYARSGASPLAQVRAAGSDTVVVGTSTARYAFHPEAWPSTMVNIAQDGQTIFFTIASAIAMRDAPKVKRIIMGIDPYDLLTGIKNPATERIWRIAPLIYNQPETSNLLAITRPDGRAPIALAMWRFRGATDKVIGKLGKLSPPKFIALPARPQNEPKLNNDAPEKPPKIHPSLFAYIDALREFSISEQRTLILTVTPAYKNPRWNLPDQTPLIQQLLSELRGAHICNLMTMDNEQYDIILAQQENFHDGIHMTREGAMAFTRMIADLSSKHCSK